jgi:hypothetical protein
MICTQRQVGRTEKSVRIAVHPEDSNQQGCRLGHRSLYVVGGKRLVKTEKTARKCNEGLDCRQQIVLNARIENPDAGMMVLCEAEKARMKKQIGLLIVVATFACCSVSNASITNAWWTADTDGNIVCRDWTWNSTQPTLWMCGAQNGVPAQPGPGLPAHMLGTILTDTAEDPTLFLGSSVNNDTGGMWIGYQVNVIMNAPFTFFGTPAVATVPADSWFLAGTVAPSFQVSGPHAGLYEGTINFSGGTPLGIGDELDFSYAINFNSALSYAFTQEMIPIFSEVPEPSTVALLAVGGLGFALRMRRNSRKGA